MTTNLFFEESISFPITVKANTITIQHVAISFIIYLSPIYITFNTSNNDLIVNINNIIKMNISGNKLALLTGLLSRALPKSYKNNTVKIDKMMNLIIVYLPFYKLYIKCYMRHKKE